MRFSLNLRSMLALMMLHIAGTSASHAFEQGSYHVIDLTESADAAAVAGRLAVPQAALDEGATEAPSHSIEKRSEFEIDYVESIGSTGNSSFEYDAVREATPEKESINFSTGTFDFGSSKTMFGD